MTVEQAAMVPQDTPARPTPELRREVEEEVEEVVKQVVKQEDPPLAEEKKPDRELLNKEVKEKDAKRLPDCPASDHSSKVRH